MGKNVHRDWSFAFSSILYLHDASVYFSSAWDRRAGTQVAIKKLHRPFQSKLFAKRAYRELRLLKHMKHENVRRQTKDIEIKVLGGTLTFNAF